MRLKVTTPLANVVDCVDVVQLTAEDETGSFGILEGHADFLTTLTVSVVSWVTSGGKHHHLAVRGGVLTIHAGRQIEIVTREAVGEETLEKLGGAVLDRMRKDEENEQAARLLSARMEVAAMRQIERYVAAGRSQFARPRAWSERGARDTELSQRDE